MKKKSIYVTKKSLHDKLKMNVQEDKEGANIE